MTVFILFALFVLLLFALIPIIQHSLIRREAKRYRKLGDKYHEQKGTWRNVGK